MNDILIIRELLFLQIVTEGFRNLPERSDNLTQNGFLYEPKVGKY